jgi:hypothetical protein
MSKKALKRKSAPKRSAVSHTKAARSTKTSGNLLQRLTHKKYWPFHAVGVGVIMVALGIFATVGLILILVAAFYYIWKSAKAHQH